MQHNKCFKCDLGAVAPRPLKQTLCVSIIMTKLHPKLILPIEFAGYAFEVASKGWYNGVTVELENGKRYSVCFYDPVRLKQDLESEGKAYLSEPGLGITGDRPRLFALIW